MLTVKEPIEPLLCSQADCRLGIFEFLPDEFLTDDSRVVCTNRASCSVLFFLFPAAYRLRDTSVCSEYLAAFALANICRYILKRSKTRQRRNTLCEISDLLKFVLGKYSLSFSGLLIFQKRFHPLPSPAHFFRFIDDFYDFLAPDSRGSDINISLLLFIAHRSSYQTTSRTRGQPSSGILIPTGTEWDM